MLAGWRGINCITVGREEVVERSGRLSTDVVNTECCMDVRDVCLTRSYGALRIERHVLLRAVTETRRCRRRHNASSRPPYPPSNVDFDAMHHALFTISIPMPLEYP